MMRSPAEIYERLAVEPAEEQHVKQILQKGLDQNVEKLAFLLTEAYEKAFLNALRHRPNGELVDNFATLTWLAGSDLNVADVPWLQYGMPRIRRLAKELKLPWLPIGDNQVTLFKAKRMSNGLPCTEGCYLCHKTR